MVEIGVVEQFIHPPLGVLGLHLDARGPFTAGSTTFSTWDGVESVSNTFGALVIPAAIPAEWGRIPRYIDAGLNVETAEYEDGWGQIVAMHQFISGAWVADQQRVLYQLRELELWESALPGRVGLWLAPGWEADIYWLRVL